jgi:hypothetical protein
VAGGLARRATIVVRLEGTEDGLGPGGFAEAAGGSAMTVVQSEGAGDGDSGAFGSSDALFAALESCSFMANAGRPYARAHTRAVSLDEVKGVAGAYLLSTSPAVAIDETLSDAWRVCATSGVRSRFVRAVRRVFAAFAMRRHQRRAGWILRPWHLRTHDGGLRDVGAFVQDCFATAALLVEKGELTRFPMLRLAAEVVLDGHVPGDIERGPEGDTLQVY